MKKALKVLGKVALWTLIVVVALVVVLPLWIGPVVKGVANAVTPGIVGTKFHLGEFGLNQYSGCLHVGDMQLANPTNIADGNCVELGKLDVNVALTSLLSKKIRVEDVVLDGLTVYATASGSNFKQIAKNAAGGDEQPEAEAQAPEAPEAKVEDVKAEEAKTEAKEGKKVQIDHLVLRNVKIKYGLVPVPVPEIELKDIGADNSDGASLSDVWTAISGAVMKAAGSVTDLGKGAVDAGAKAAGATVDAVGNAAGAVGDAAGKAAGALGDAAGAAADKLKGLFK